MVDGEACALSTSAMTRAFSHLYLRDPSFDLGALLKPVDPELYTVAAEAVKDQVEGLLRKFLAIDTAGTAGGKDGCDSDVIINNEVPQVGDGGIQG